MYCKRQKQVGRSATYQKGRREGKRKQAQGEPLSCLARSQRRGRSRLRALSERACTSPFKLRPRRRPYQRGTYGIWHLLRKPSMCTRHVQEKTELPMGSRKIINSHGKRPRGYRRPRTKRGKLHLFFNTRLMILSLSEKQVSQLKETINRRGLKPRPERARGVQYALVEGFPAQLLLKLLQSVARLTARERS